MMNRFARALSRAAAITLLPLLLFTQGVAAQDNPKAVIHTSMGVIQVELYPDRAPASVENFINYANSGFYDGTIFHRVIRNFMIQGGGFTPDMQKKTTGEPVRNEANNGLGNQRGTVAMARTNDPHSATAQFFINVQDNWNLDYRGENSWGYTVFARVTEGMEVVDKIRFVKTTRKQSYSDVPVDPVIIEKIEILN